MNDKTVFRNPLKIQTLLDALQTIIDEEPDVYPDYRRVTLREAKEWLSDCYRMVELYQDRIVPGFRERLAKRVEVVRCKDCKMWKRHKGITVSSNGHCFINDTCMNQNDFCSYGERKDE